jgi:hypothetical protein
LRKSELLFKTCPPGRANVIALASINQITRLRCQDFAGAHFVALTLSSASLPASSIWIASMPTIRPCSKEIDFNDWAHASMISICGGELWLRLQKIVRRSPERGTIPLRGDSGGTSAARFRHQTSHIGHQQVFDQHSTGLHAGLTMHF